MGLMRAGGRGRCVLPMSLRLPPGLEQNRSLEGRGGDDQGSFSACECWSHTPVIPPHAVCASHEPGTERGHCVPRSK